MEELAKKGILMVTQGTIFFKQSSREALGRSFFSTLKAMKNFATANGSGFMTINSAEEEVLPHVLNGGCMVAKIYGSQRMGAYEFWNTERIRNHSLCQKCEGACIRKQDSHNLVVTPIGCHKAAALGSRKLAPMMREDFESEIGDLDWRDNQIPAEQEQDYQARIGDYGYVTGEEESESEEPRVISLFASGEKLDFFELERRMLQQETLQKEAVRKKLEKLKANHTPLAVLISRKEMREILSPEEEAVLAEALAATKAEASQAQGFHQCGWFVALRYPELNGKDRRCNLCAKWRNVGDNIWPSRKTQDVNMMNANILIRTPDQVVTDAKATLQFCRNQYRSNFLDHLVKEYILQVKAGILPWEVLPAPFMWEVHLDAIKSQLIDLDSIGWFGTNRMVENQVSNILQSASRTQKKNAVKQLSWFLQKYREAKGLQNLDNNRDQKMVTAWLDAQLSAYRLPYSDDLWCPPNKSAPKPCAGPQPRYTTPAICMGCLVHRQGRC
ncbi:MAG: hypothetical protein J5U19_08525 [Candidatus Methanoperedens sp.]|nr:hypothetical protein [Candidatus Methanoperedens sp.]